MVVESAAAVTVTVAAVGLEVVVAAATRKPAEVVSLTPQIASASKVKSMFLALHSLCCRVMESRSQSSVTVILDVVDEWYKGQEGKNRNNKLTRHDIRVTILHAAEVRLAVLLLVTHACWVVCAGPAGEAVEVAVVLSKIYILVIKLLCICN